MPQYFFLYSSFLGYGFPVPLLASFGTALLYLLLAFVIWPYTRPKTPQGVQFWTSVRKIHNIALFLYSVATAVIIGGWLFIDGQLGSWQRNTCEPIPEWVWYANHLFIISKLWEWADTMFLVFLKPGAPKTFLHVYHHATTFWLFLNMANLPGMLKTALFLNSAVHALMYAHYAWPFPKPLVPCITFLQIAQLMFGTYQWHVTPSTCPQFASFPSKYPLEFVTPYAFAPVYIIFFIHFFIQRFVLKKPKAKAAASKQK